MKSKHDKQRVSANHPFLGLLTVLGSVVAFLIFLVALTVVIHFIVM